MLSADVFPALIINTRIPSNPTRGSILKKSFKRGGEGRERRSNVTTTRDSKHNCLPVHVQTCGYSDSEILVSTIIPPHLLHVLIARAMHALVTQFTPRGQ